MRTDTGDVRPNARLISIKCRIRAVSARVARGERSRARRGARNLWKFCKWPIDEALAQPRRRGIAQRGATLPLSPIDGAEKFLRKQRPPAKNLGVKFFRQPGGAPPLQTECLLRVVALPQQCLFGTKLPMIQTLDDTCWKWSKRASSTSIVASLHRLAVVPFHSVQQLDRNVA